MAAAPAVAPEVQKEAEVIVSPAIAHTTVQPRDRGPWQPPPPPAAVERSDTRRYCLAPLPAAGFNCTAGCPLLARCGGQACRSCLHVSAGERRMRWRQCHNCVEAGALS